MGVFIGLNPTTSERIVWDVEDHRIHFTQTMHRRPVESRWCRDYVLGINCIPYRYEAARLDEFGLQKSVNVWHVERPDVPKLRPLAQEQRDYKFRALYLVKDIIKEFGFTADCPGCKNVMNNIGGKPHTEACRTRIMQCLATSDNPKYKENVNN